jgi:hypothetical protein
MLLCPNHHTLVDMDDVAGHPPSVLYAMLTRKSDTLAEVIAAYLEEQGAVLDAAAIEESLTVTHILELMDRARGGGPNAGNSLAQAEKRLDELLKNPHVPKRSVFRVIRISLYAMRARTSYDTRSWETLLRNARKHFDRIEGATLTSAALAPMIVFVRNEFAALDRAHVIEIRKLLLSRVDEALLQASEDDVKLRARLLSHRAALLRWQGRLEHVPAIRIARLEEAQRCAAKSLKLRWSATAELQRITTLFSRAISRERDEADQADREIASVATALLQPELDDSPNAIRYRPRLLHEIHENDAAVSCFWEAVAQGYLWEMRITAFVLVEAATADICYPGQRLPPSFSAVAEFIEDSVDQGFSHGRNIMSCLIARALVDPDWFRGEVFEKLRCVTDSRSEEGRKDWCAVLKGSNIVRDNSSPHDLLFGIDNCHFWNQLARTCRVALADATVALEFHQIARAHAENLAHRFSIHVGMARCHAQMNEIGLAKNEIGRAMNYARGCQVRVVREVQAEIARISPKTEDAVE